MAGSTHSLTMVNDFKKVYPHSEDIEAYPGGNFYEAAIFLLLRERELS